MRVFFVSAFFFLTLILNAQPNIYMTDLAALKSFVEKTTSFKGQIKGDKLSYYNELYTRLASDTAHDPNSYKYFYNLAQLLFPLRDNHLAFYQLPNYNNFKTKETIDSFVTTNEFLSYPTIKMDLDSLRSELSKKSAEWVEGIYHYDKFYTVGLYKSGDKEYIGVVLDSDINLWVKGQIAIHLYETAPNIYKAIYAHPLLKYYKLQPVEKYQNQSLVNSFFYGSYSQKVYSKQLQQVDYVNLPKNSSKFALRNVNDDVQYLLIQTFQTNTTTSHRSKQFYDSIKTLLKTQYLILDLRNNEGGAEKEMKKYFKLLKEYVQNGHLYVLVNNGTLSQAEIFALELKRLKNVITVGQQTKGMLSYGSNYDKREKLPSGKFEFYPTDMDNGSELLPYEDFGIKPDIILTGESDWIEQVVEVLRRK